LEEEGKAGRWRKKARLAAAQPALPRDVTAIGPLRRWRAMALSALTRNHYTKKRIRFIPNEVNSKIHPYPNPIKSRRKARAEGGPGKSLLLLLLLVLLSGHG
jgi:hypothetical protein